MRISYGRVTSIIWLSALAFLTYPPTAIAYTFTLSEGEFLSWPDYCKVVYVRLDVGKASGYSRLISPSELASGSAVLREAELSGRGPYGGDGRHHFCAGMIWLNRAKLETDPQRRRSQLGQAREETKFTLERADTRGASFALAAAQMATIMFEAGDKAAAHKVLRNAISQPNSNQALFMTQAMIYYREGEYEKSKVALQEGIEQADSVSADVHYNLGLVLLKLGDPESAAEQAHLAYDKGYPLPGLRQKLKRMGYWEPKE